MKPDDVGTRIPRRTVQLVAAAQRGDRNAMEELFGRYLPRVRTIVALRIDRRLRDMAALEDIVQDSLLRIFRNLRQYEERSESSFLNWVSRCVRNEVTEYLRREGAKKRGGGRAIKSIGLQEESDLAFSMFAGDMPTPSEVARGRELGKKIEEGLLALPIHERELVIQRRLCGMSYAELAKEFGFDKEASVRKAVSRALKKLREHVDR